MYWTTKDSENVLIYNSIENSYHRGTFFEDKLQNQINTMISIELRLVNRDNDKDLAANAMLKVLENIHRINQAQTAQYYLMRIVRSSVRLYLMRQNPDRKLDTRVESGFVGINKVEIASESKFEFEKLQDLAATRKRIIKELERKQRENPPLSRFIEAIKGYILLNDYEPTGCKEVVCQQLNIKPSTFAEYCNRLDIKRRVFK